MKKIRPHISEILFLSIYLTLFCFCSQTIAQEKDRGRHIQLTLGIDHPELSEKTNGIFKKDVDSICHILQHRFSALGIIDVNIKPDLPHSSIQLTVIWPYDDDKLLTYATAMGKLEILETYTNEEFFPYLLGANDTLGKLQPQNYVTPQRTEQEDFLYHNPVFAVITPFISEKAELVPGPVIGRIYKKDKKKLDQLLRNKLLGAIWPPDVQIVMEHDGPDSTCLLYAIKTPRKPNTMIDTKDIRLAKAVNDDKYSHQEIVVLEMTAAGTRKWKDMTAQNIGRYVVFMLENKVFSSPKVLDTISDGGAAIHANLTAEQAQDIANIINNGQMPLPVHLVSFDMDKH